MASSPRRSFKTLSFGQRQVPGCRHRGAPPGGHGRWFRPGAQCSLCGIWGPPARPRGVLLRVPVGCSCASPWGAPASPPHSPAPLCAPGTEPPLRRPAGLSWRPRTVAGHGCLFRSRDGTPATGSFSLRQRLTAPRHPPLPELGVGQHAASNESAEAPSGETAESRGGAGGGLGARSGAGCTVCTYGAPTVCPSKAPGCSLRVCGGRAHYVHVEISRHPERLRSCSLDPAG